MSLTITIPTPWRRRTPQCPDTDAVALAVADVTSLHLTAPAVRAVVDETLRRYGGPEGVRVELDRRLAETPERTTRTLAWARRTIASVQLEATS